MAFLRFYRYSNQFALGIGLIRKDPAACCRAEAIPSAFLFGGDKHEQGNCATKGKAAISQGAKTATPAGVPL